MDKNNIKYYFKISASSGVPIYRQIIDQVKTLIATGQLTDGIFLPSVRKVSKELEINPMTVSKAYSILEKEDVLEFVRGQGMRVQGLKVSQKNFEQREQDMMPLLREVVMKAKQLSLRPKKVNDMLNQAWKETEHE